MASILTSGRTEPSTVIVEGYSWWRSVWKWVKHAGTTLHGLAVAELSRLASEYVRKHAWIFVLVAIFVAGTIGMLANWLKHRRDGRARITVTPLPETTYRYVPGHGPE